VFSLCIRIENRDCNLLYPGCEASLASWGKVTSTHEPCYGTGIYPDSTCAPESKVNFPSWCETQCAARFQAFPTLPPLPAAAAAPTTTSPWPTPITTIPNFSVSLREFCQVDQNCQGWIGPLNCGQEGSFCRDKTCQKYKLECDVGFCETTSVSGNTTYQCQAGQNLHENTGLCCPDWIDDCRQYCNDYYDQQYTTGPLWCSQEEANSGAIFYLGDTCYICKKKGLYPAVVQEVACPSTEKPTPTPTATPVPNKEDEIKYAERGEINANCALPCRNPKEACFDNPWWLGNRCTDNHCEDVPDGNYVTVYPFCFRCQGEKPVERVDFDEFCESSSKPSSGLIKSVWAIEPEIESSIKLLEGWNLISLAVRPEKALTASDLVAEINRQGGLAIAVSQWQNSFWQTYLTGLDKNDFLIEPGQAYFVENLAEVEVIFSGKPINEPLPLNLKTGWNAVGFPNTREIYSAKTLLDKSPSLQTTGFFESGLWLAATKKDEDFFGIDFPILPGRGYFLKTLFPLRFSP